ncbi:MAG: pyruvate kinase [Mailhella sp.]|nr:pyruvate kinase [Mailhella sp.]
MRTKIIATIGPASSSPEMIRSLSDNGVSIFRLNFSHGDRDFFKYVIGSIRAVEKETGRILTILQDLPGPKIRLGDLAEGSLRVEKGMQVVLGPSAEGLGLPLLDFDDPVVLASLHEGDRVLLADGMLEFRVTRQLPGPKAILTAQNHGLVTSRKGVAVPGRTLPLPALTDRDRELVRLGVELGVDAVALSFVQGAEDIRQLRLLLRSLGASLPIVAKLERQSALDCLDEIIAETDIVMVARGDLAVECSLPCIPALQKRIISACGRVAKPVIVATQMLLSMTGNPVPTRAETTDVANAVVDGADCVMLSEETAVGKYPAESVRFMKEIAEETERWMAENMTLRHPAEAGTTLEFLAYTACLLAQKTAAHSIAGHSVTGKFARLLSTCRPVQPVRILTPDRKIMHTVNFSWGIEPHLVEDDPDVGHLARVQRMIASDRSFPRGCDVVITAGEHQPGDDSVATNVIKIFRK